jgi:parvulin-like peptidyl-prolyl isomerase
MVQRSTAVALVLVVIAAAASVVEAGDALSVNGVTVSAAEVALARYWAKLEAPYPASDDATATASAVDKVVADILLAGEASATGETLGKKEVKEGIAAFRSRVGGEAAYQDVLRVTGASEDDLARLVERHRLARRYIEQRIAPTVSVSEAEARAWYEEPGHQVHHFDQIRVRLIFINSKEGESADAEAKARERIEAAAARIGAGEDFAAVARAVSEDLSRQIGGEIGWVSRGAIPGPMEDLVWRLDTGETSGVLRGPYGFALIQVVDRRPAGPSPFEEVRDSVISDLEADRTAQAVAEAVAGLRSKATITVHDPSLGWSPE